METSKSLTLALLLVSATSCGPDARPWLVFTRSAADYAVSVTACDGQGKACADGKVAEVFSAQDPALRKVLGLQHASTLGAISLELQLSDGSTARCDRLVIDLNKVGNQATVALAAGAPAKATATCDQEACSWSTCVAR